MAIIRRPTTQPATAGAQRSMRMVRLSASVVLWIILWFLLGYAFYGSLYAAGGSLASNNPRKWFNDQMTQQEAWKRLAGSDVGRLATVDSAGRPHLVPFVFAVVDQSIISLVDHKPKRTRDLQRLKNISANPRVSVLVDHYEDDWSRLWWVRADGQARVVKGGGELEKCIDLVVGAFPQYADSRPLGPAVVINVEHITSWSANA